MLFHGKSNNCINGYLIRVTMEERIGWLEKIKRKTIVILSLTLRELDKLDAYN